MHAMVRLQQLLIAAVGIGLISLLTFDAPPAQATKAAKSAKSSKIAQSSDRRANKGREQITIRFAELNPENFLRFEARENVEADDTELSEEHRPARRERVRKSQVKASVTDARSGTATVPGPPGPPPPPTPNLVVGPFEPIFTDGDPYDFSVAAGVNYVAVVASHHVNFYDKQGQQLVETILQPLPNPPKVVPYRIDSFELFQTFLSSTSPNNVNLQAGFPANPAISCQLAGVTPPARPAFPCINEVFDMRVAYDAKHARFIFVGAARNALWGCAAYDSSQCDPTHGLNPLPCLSTDAACKKSVAMLARRYTMIAITKHEDPRQGMYTYWLPTSGDWPQIAINGSRLLITFDSLCQDSVACPNIPYPAIYVLSTDDLAAGKSNPAVSWYMPNQTGFSDPRSIRPVISRDPGSPDYFVAGVSSALQVWTPNTVTTKPLVTSKIDIGQNSFIRGNVVLQSGKLYHTYGTLAAGCPGTFPAFCPYQVRLLAVNVKLANNTLTLSKAKLPNGNDFDYLFGTNGPGDSPGDVVSYEIPELEVTKNGDIVIVYVRRAIKTANTLFNEARYSLFYHDQSSTSPSAILKKGEGNATKNPYDAIIDLTVQSLDPDGLTVWVTHAYAKSDGNCHMAVGAVKP